ncbi:MAG TPA: hypothetical protein VKA38_00130, partial [Draconibacterium sp.]|nr:hypothetical protein [Draconibacterium sp.]
LSGGSKNIFAENCDMNSPALQRAIRIKTNNNRGGVSDGIYIRDLKVGQVSEAVVKINCSYDPREGQGEFMPVVKNVYVSNITTQKSRYGLSLIGIKGENCVENIYINNCKFNGVTQGNQVQYVKNLNLNDLLVNGEKVDQINLEN